MLSIIIINYNTSEQTIKCIKHIINSTINFLYEVIVVDNNSTDDSIITIKKQFSNVKIILNNNNFGFGKANNIGISEAKGEYLLLLNSDVYVNTNTIQDCLEKLIKNTNINVIGCQLRNSDESIQKSTYTYIAEYEGLLKNNILYAYFNRVNKNEVKALMGSFLMMPKKTFDCVGKFDSDFFMYAEEMEWFYRFSKHKLNLFYNSDVWAIHEHGASSKKNWSAKQASLSTALLFLKTKGLIGYLNYHLIMLFNSLVNGILMWLTDKNVKDDRISDIKIYFSNFIYYFTIPCYYSRNKINGKRQLKRA